RRANALPNASRLSPSSAATSTPSRVVSPATASSTTERTSRGVAACNPVPTMAADSASTTRTGCRQQAAASRLIQPGRREGPWVGDVVGASVSTHDPSSAAPTSGDVAFLVGRPTRSEEQHGPSEEDQRGDPPHERAGGAGGHLHDPSEAFLDLLEIRTHRRADGAERLRTDGTDDAVERAVGQHPAQPVQTGGETHDDQN